ncbi:unnamed protein product [Closterium sp. NIES-54]
MLPESPQQNGVAERRIGLVMDIARTSMIHASAPHFLWPYAVRYAAHQLNLQPRVSRPEASPTCLWTRSSGVGSAFRVLGCLALVWDTSADKLLARAIPCIFLGFPVDSPDYAFYHPPLHQFLDSRDVPVDFGGVGAGGTRSGGALLWGAGAGGAGIGGASSGGAGAGGAGAGGANSEGARAGGASAGGSSFWGARAGGTGTGGASSEETGAGGTTNAPPHHHDARLQAARRLSDLWALGISSAPPDDSLSPTLYGPTFPPQDSAPAVFSPQSQSPPPVLPHDWTTRCPPRARPSSPFDDLHTVLFRSSTRHAPPVSVLPPPPASSLTASSHPITDYYRDIGRVVSRVLASLVTNPRASPSSILALTAAVANFASTHRLDFAMRVVAAPPARPLSAEAQRDYELHSLDFSTAFLQGSLHEEIWLRRPPGFTGTFPPGTQWSLRRPVYGLCQAPREWHGMLRTTLAALGFRPSSADPSLFVLQRFGLQHSTTQPTPLAVDHRLTGPFSDEPFESSGPYAELVGCLMYLMTCTRPDLAFPLSVLSRFVAIGRHRLVHWTAAVRVAKYMATTLGMGLVLGGRHLVVMTGHYDSSYADDVETQRSTQGYCFSLGAGAVSRRSTRSSSVASTLPHQLRCPACRAALLAARCPALPVAPPSLPRAALPCELHRPALPARCPAGRAPSCPARAPPCQLPHRPNLPARRPTSLPCRPSLPARRPTACRAALPRLRAACWPPRRPALPARRPAGRRAALQAAKPPCTDHAPPCWLSHRPALPARRPAGRRWLTRDAAARLAVRNHPPLAERAHFGQHKTAKALYDVVVTRYSSPATAALGRLILPYLFPELSAFATVEDLITHLRTSDTRYRNALKAEFLDKNPPPMYITLYFIVTCLPDSLRAVRDHFFALDLTDLTVDLLEKHLLAAETSVVAIGAARGTPRTPFFEGCSLSPLAPSYASAAAIDILGAEDVGAASALSGKHRNSKGKGGKSGGSGSGGGGGGGSGGGGGGGGGGSSGSGGGSGGFGGGSGGSGGGGGGGGGGSESGGDSGSGGGGSGGGRGGAVQRGGGSLRCPCVIRTSDCAGQTCGKFHTQHRCFSRLDNALRAQFGDEAERPRWLELLRSGVDIFALDYDAILVAMYALSVSHEGECYLCMLPDQGIEAAALGASESSLPGTAPAEALHTFTLDTGASC